MTSTTMMASSRPTPGDVSTPAGALESKSLIGVRFVLFSLART
jgi:hypothetical protein